MGLVGDNKRFLYAAVCDPRSTHVARLLQNTSLFREILEGGYIPDKQIPLGKYGCVPLVTIGDCTFPKFQWLLKNYDDKSTDPQQRHFRQKMHTTC